MKTRSLLCWLVAPVLCAFAPLAHADFIPCPAKTTWKVTTPLPDPWSSTMQESAYAEQVTVLINSVEWLVCRYSHAPGEMGLYSMSAPNQFRVRLQRPPMQDASFSLATCPSKTITTEVVSPVPAPWKSTKYVWTLTGITKDELGGQDVLMCTYVAPLDSQGVGPTSLLQPLNLGDEKPLAGTPKPDPKPPGNFAAEFAVTNVSLATVPAPRQRACPAKVGFQGSIEVNGPGEVIYRVVDNKGVAGPQQKLVFSKAGAKPLAFQINVDAPAPPPSGPVGSKVTAPAPAGPQVTSAGGGGPAASSNIAGSSTPGSLWGFRRIEILAPTGGKTKSQDAAWSLQCVTPTQKPGATSIQAQPKKPPPSLGAPKTPPPSKPVDPAAPNGADRK